MITDISSILKTQEITLSGWDDGEVTFNLRRPSLLALAKNGKIPNPLISAANSLFNSGMTDNKENLKNVGEVLHIVAAESLVSPTIEEISVAGLELTDMQLLQIFQFAQRGAASLRRFRELSGDTVADIDGEGIPVQAE